MGKHAKPKPAVNTRRVTAVSAGTLLLCLWGTGTALAASSPYDGGTGTGTLSTVTGTVTSTVTSVVATPSPSPSSDPIQQVTDTVTGTVQQVTDAAGLPDPLATPTPTATGSGGTGTGSGTVSGTTGGGRTDTGTGLPSSDRGGVHQGGLTMAARTPKAMPHLSTVTMTAGMPSRSWLAGRAPAVSPQQHSAVGTHQVYAAGPATLLAPASNGIGLPAGNDAGPRALLLVVATAVVAGLSTAHVVVAQRRLATVTA